MKAARKSIPQLTPQLISPAQRIAVEQCVQFNIPFALYALPGETTMTFMASAPTPDELLNNKPIPGAGVELTMYGVHPKPSYTIVPEMDEHALCAFAHKLAAPFPAADNVPSPRSSSAVGYLAATHEIIRSLGRRTDRKVVYSRIIAGTTPITAVTDIAAEYFLTFPNTLRIIWFTQETGLWVTATPELLIEFEAHPGAPIDDDGDRPGTLRTMALAGTRLVGEPGEWDVKNVDEQLAVTKYVSSIVGTICPDSLRTEHTTLRHGLVEHLCTTLTAETTMARARLLGSILDPTPAVCGSPLKGALAAIERYEAHERTCYTGTITINSPDGGFRTYVNLRTIFLAPQRNHSGRICGFDYNIPTGGGITCRSVPAVEWHETTLKAVHALIALHGEKAIEHDMGSLSEAIDAELGLQPPQEQES